MVIRRRVSINLDEYYYAVNFGGSYPFETVEAANRFAQEAKKLLDRRWRHIVRKESFRYGWGEIGLGTEVVASHYETGDECKVEGCTVIHDLEKVRS